RRFAPALAEAADGHLDPLLVVDDGSDAPLPPGAVDYEAALSAADPDPAAPPTPSPDDVHIVHTGGTTGRPKGVLWRQADFLAGALGVRGTVEELAEAAARAPDGRLRTLPAPPLMHGAAHWNALSCLAAGGTVVIQSRPEHLDPE